MAERRVHGLAAGAAGQRAALRVARWKPLEIAPYSSVRFPGTIRLAVTGAETHPTQFLRRHMVAGPGNHLRVSESVVVVNDTDRLTIAMPIRAKRRFTSGFCFRYGSKHRVQETRNTEFVASISTSQERGLRASGRDNIDVAVNVRWDSIAPSRIGAFASNPLLITDIVTDYGPPPPYLSKKAIARSRASLRVRAPLSRRCRTPIVYQQRELDARANTRRIHQPERAPYGYLALWQTEQSPSGARPRRS